MDCLGFAHAGLSRFAATKKGGLSVSGSGLFGLNIREVLLDR